MNPISPSLIRRSQAICQDSRFKETLLRHLFPSEDRSVDPRDLNLTIAAADQMFIHSLQHHQNAAVALSQYFNVSLQQFRALRQILEARFGSERDEVKILDFACGYGRLLRLLTLYLPAAQIRASEIQPGALEFVADFFGVQGYPSSADPSNFEPGERFDFIWVASLFSHLPDTLFQSWLEKLIALLTPNGVLCFSVRGSELLPAGIELPGTGFIYQRASEATPLDADVYGTAYASEPYVHHAVEKALGVGHPLMRLRRALAHEQDLYVLAKNPVLDLRTLSEFRPGPWGWVDKLELSSAGRLDIQGWAASMDDVDLECVLIMINGQSQSIQTGILREDVAAAFSDQRLTKSGWSFLSQLNLDAGRPYIEISAKAAGNVLALLYAGEIEPTPS